MEGPIPPEGGAALEEKVSDGPDVNVVDEQVQHAVEDEVSPARRNTEEPEERHEADVSEKVPRTVDTRNSLVPSGGEESDSDASAQKVQPSEISVLLRRIDQLEDKILSLEKKLDAKLERVVNAVGRDGNDGGEMANIIHSLCHHLDNNVDSSSYLENKLLPLKTVLNGGMHRKCLGKFIIDKLVGALGGGTELDPKVLNNVAKIIRVVLHSKSVGGKKDTKSADHGDLDLLSREMKGRMTWILINHIQSNANIGKQTVCVGDDTKLVNKPYWMESGFTEKKHINEFYSKNRRGKTVSKREQKDVLA